MRIAINTCKNHRRTSWFSKVNPVEEEAILETASHENIEIDLVEAEGSKVLRRSLLMAMLHLHSCHMMICFSRLALLQILFPTAMQS